MKNQVPPITIEDVSKMLIPDHLKEHFQLTDIAPENVTIQELKDPTAESKKFLEILSYAFQLAGIEVSFDN